MACNIRLKESVYPPKSQPSTPRPILEVASLSQRLRVKQDHHTRLSAKQSSACVATKDFEGPSRPLADPRDGTVSLKPGDRPRNRHPVSKTVSNRRRKPRAARCEDRVLLGQELPGLSLSDRFNNKNSGKWQDGGRDEF